MAPTFTCEPILIWRVEMLFSPTIGGIYKIHYGKRYPGMPYQDRHCRLVQVAKGRPKNVLVRLKEGVLVVVPIGNLIKPDKR
jgi:hypothetical protein